MTSLRRLLSLSDIILVFESCFCDWGSATVTLGSVLISGLV